MEELTKRKAEFGNTDNIIGLIRRRIEYRVGNIEKTEESDRETALYLAILSSLKRLKELEEK